MKQHSLGLGQTAKRTRRREFLDEMERVVPWADLVALVSPHLPEGKRGRPPYSAETLLRIHFMQQGFALSDPAMEEALHDMPVLREFAGREGRDERLSAKGVMLRSGTVVDATLTRPESGRGWSTRPG